MAYKIDCSGAGTDVDACRQGTERFRARYPDLGWSISAGRNGHDLVLTVEIPGKHIQQLTVAPTIDMAGSVFTALEQLLISK
jgi:hypothetical protein